MSITPLSATTFTIGSAFQWSCSAVNNSGGSLTYSIKFYVTPSSGVKINVRPPTGATSIKNGSKYGTTSATTTSAYTSLTGTVTFECDAVDKSNNILGSATLALNVLPLPASVVAPHFTDVAGTAGVSFTHHADTTNCMNMMGTGAGWADYDHSGHPSFFVSDYNGGSHLFHNNGPGANPQFTDVTATAFPSSDLSSGVLKIKSATGATWADYNNDGFPDLLILSANADPRLYMNNGNGTFTNATMMAFPGAMWMNMMMNMPLRMSGAAWGDYDGDGYLDLYIANYMGCMVSGMTMGDPGMLFHNNGNGTFTEVTYNIFGGDAMMPPMSISSMALQATWIDYNNDNRPDLYIADDAGAMKNSMMTNMLFTNGGGTSPTSWSLTDAGIGSGAEIGMSAMGIGVFDFNRDGNPDIAVSNIAPNKLLQNNGNGTFTEIGQSAGFMRDGFLNSAGTGFSTSVTWGVGTADFNNDGWEDAVLGGGQMASSGSVNMPNGLLINNFSGHLTGMTSDSAFLDLTYAAGMGNVHTAPTIAVADYDGDGFEDFVDVNFKNEALNLYHNDGATGGNWLEVRAVGGCMNTTTTSCAPNSGLSNADGVGAKLKLTSAGGTQYRQIIDGSSLGGNNQLIAHFGLGSDTSITSLTITWPSGLVQTFSGLSVNQRISITEGSSTLGTF